MTTTCQQSVCCLFDDVGGEGVVAGDADGMARQWVGAPPGCTATGLAKVVQRGEEDLAVGGRYQVVEDGINGRAHIVQDVGQHVEIVVEVIQTSVSKQTEILVHQISHVNTEMLQTSVTIKYPGCLV